MAKATRRAISLGQTALSFATAAARPEGVALARGFEATVNGLVVEGTPGFEQWVTVGRKLRVVEKGAQFALGDYILYGESAYGEKASQELDAENGWSLSTIRVYSWLASRIAPADRRMDRLGIKHHQLVAALTPAKQRQWLTRAADDEMAEPWTAARLAKAIREGEDLPESAWFVIVTCPTGQVQSDLMDRLEAEGLSCKASTRRGRRPAQEES